jgi:hypothetical protein
VSSFLSKLARPFKGKRKKSESEVAMRPPSYVGRHAGCDALVLVTGPTASSLQGDVLDFIARRRPLVFGCNNLPEGYEVDYHVYVNRQRFMDHGHKLGAECRLLLSPYFLDSQIQKVLGSRAYELLMYRNIYPGSEGSLDIRDGAVYAQGATVGPLACGAALVMGAKNLFIAGMDGYSISAETHHYAEPDNKQRDELLEQERRTHGLLKDIAGFCEAAGGRLRLITPTAYEQYHDPALLAGEDLQPT